MESPSGPESPNRGPQSPAPYTPPGPSPEHGGQMPPGGWQQSLSPTVPPRAPLASWGSRAAAFAIDFAVVGVAPGIIAFGLLGGTGSTGAWIAGILVWFLIVIVMVLLYAPLLMMRSGERSGQTWGKQVLGIRAIRDNGQEWDYGSACFREVVLKNLAVWVASFIIPVLPWFLDYFWPLWDDENRALHDMAAKSHVVHA
jgi:uncharacterized RDD family membrane protein YckC